MKLPAVTLCLCSLLTYSTNATLHESLINCKIGEDECDIKDFYSFKARTTLTNVTITCYVLNGGRNSTGHSSEIKSTRTTGFYSGFEMSFFLPKDHYFFYYINDPFVEPTSPEIIKYVLSGTSDILILEKTVETKLEYPFNNCWDRVNLPDTPLVRHLTEANITYRQVNCFELCFQNYIQNYALEHEINEDEARLNEKVKNYDKMKNCKHLCPLECESTQYKISESIFFLADFSDNSEYILKWIPIIRKRLNITINSIEEFIKNYVEISIFYDNLQYTRISQTPKTTLSTLVSNLGGSTGLFLDLSFMSVCRAVEFLLGIFLKF